MFIMGCSLFDQGVLYQFTEMQCVDYAWENDSDHEQWAENVQVYLEEEGVSVNKIEALNDNDTHCAACILCATGRYIEVWIDEEDGNMIKDLGFFAVSD